MRPCQPPAQPLPSHATPAQVLGHSKTILVLLGGWLFLGDTITGKKFAGMALAVSGMIWCAWGAGRHRMCARGRALLGGCWVVVGCCGRAVGHARGSRVSAVQVHAGLQRGRRASSPAFTSGPLASTPWPQPPPSPPPSPLQVRHRQRGGSQAGGEGQGTHAERGGSREGGAAGGGGPGRQAGQ